MPFQEVMAILGNLGEFIGAIAVVATLFYLAVQVRHGKEATEANTRSLEESRKIALVRTYQARAAESAASLRMFVDSDVARLTVKHIQSGVDSLTPEERYKVKQFQMNNVERIDASYFAFQQGLLPEYEADFVETIKQLGPLWRSLGLRLGRKSFEDEVNRILSLNN
jgi:hypothetical protein